MIESLDVLREEAADRTPGTGGFHNGAMMSIGLHCRLIGHASRIRGLRRVLEHAAKCPDVWVTTRLAIAEHWREAHPPPLAG